MVLTLLQKSWVGPLNLVGFYSCNLYAGLVCLWTQSGCVGGLCKRENGRLEGLSWGASMRESSLVQLSKKVAAWIQRPGLATCGWRVDISPVCTTFVGVSSTWDRFKLATILNFGAGKGSTMSVHARFRYLSPIILFNRAMEYYLKKKTQSI